MGKEINIPCRKFFKCLYRYSAFIRKAKTLSTWICSSCLQEIPYGRGGEAIILQYYTAP